ncbi:Glycerophosphoryl diester phosphodiesterase [Macrophomina phaseolina MS6]|uniref:Glycerophosphoryl diester phosphodiesterase n=1 Tax=Macrophomina phaseolina (strain MS6) TaxID=1126212 RepID=K2R782_MACPH|nr:Glycerophosphoryl diester phosphodiesterase [Macrophomina phaseolina MS6]
MSPKKTVVAVTLSGLVGLVGAARQPYDVKKIINAFRNPPDDLTILCAHRGLRWNGTADNSYESYFRAPEAGIECVETDIRLSLDGYLPMIHDSGLGRETDVGEQTGKAAYNPFTGQGYSPKVSESNFSGFIENLHRRDELGRVRREQVATLPDMIQNIHEAKTNVVLQLDFKDQAAVEPAYWALKNLTNAAGIPANEWCIYKLQAEWYRSPEEFEALEWVQDAFASGIELAFIPVYQPGDVAEWDVLASLQSFAKTNYTISAEIELQSTGGALQHLNDYLDGDEWDGVFNSRGIFFAIGDFADPFTSNLTFFDTANYTLPDDIRTNNSVFVYRDNAAPVLLDTLANDKFHDSRSDFAWIIDQGYHWVITDTADEWHHRLKDQGKRNLSSLVADGQELVDPTWGSGWYKARRHARDLDSNI